MAKDYKRRARPGRGAARQWPRWTWMLFGLALGLGVAYAVHLYHTGGLPNDAVAEVRRVTEGPAPSIAGRPPGEERVAPPPRARFEFYSLLPEMEVVVPDHEVTPRRNPRADAPPPAGPATEAASIRYVLQAGAFRRLEDADRMRAILALSGMEARIQTVAIDGSETWHRVRLGPYSDLESLGAARARLHQAGIAPIVLKIRV